MIGGRGMVEGEYDGSGEYGGSGEYDGSRGV